MDAWLVPLAMEAVRSLSSGSDEDDWWFCFACEQVFNKPDRWSQLKVDFADFVSARLLRSREQPSNVGFDDHLGVRAEPDGVDDSAESGYGSERQRELPRTVPKSEQD